METLPKTNTYSSVAKGIMKVLLYSDVFHYPLTLEEIKQRHPLKNITNEEVQKELFELLEKKQSFR